MKKINLLIQFLLFALFAYSQTINNPQIKSKRTGDIYIKSIVTTEFYTQINFIYKNSTSHGHYILLTPAGHKDAYYIKSDEQTYKLLSTQNIGNINGITVAMPNKSVEFSAKFERVPSNITKFDLIEGATGTWDFYGVELQQTSGNDGVPEESTQFRKDYKQFCTFDGKIDKWGDWNSMNFTFVFNINNNGDCKMFAPDGSVEVFRSVSKTEEGKTDNGVKTQSMKILDEKGREIVLILYNNGQLLLYYNDKVRYQFSEE